MTSQAGALQKAVQAGLLGHHGFALGDAPGTVLLANVQYDAIELVAIARKMHMVAVVDGFLFELAQVVFQMVQAVLAHLFDVLAQTVETLETVYSR